MSENSSHKIPKRVLDKDLDRFASVEEAAGFLSRRLVAPGLALLFLASAAIFASLYVFDEPRAAVIVAAAVIAGYMALNIGANDVANNVGPAVGARAITMGGALVMAAVAETAGALLAGGQVVETVASGIIFPDAITDPGTFIRVMLAALIASALWIHLSSYIRAPVSTTHAIVGGVMGAGIAAAGLSAVNWASMGAITASWMLSPFLGGFIAALLLVFIETSITERTDKITSAIRVVPLLIAAMLGAFSTYLANTLSGHDLLHLDRVQLLIVGLVVFVAAWIIFHGIVKGQAVGLENRNQSLKLLFTIPLLISAALLSFAHGANDVANAVGPLAGIFHAADTGAVAERVSVPFWVILIGALGISVGLMLFGPRLIRMVGAEITKLNPLRAFCIAAATSFTVMGASAFGMPVSTTHIAVGAVFGVGFYREWSASRPAARRAAERMAPALDPDPQAGGKKGSQQEIIRRRLVRRAHVTTIVTAWLTTVPASAGLAALIFYAMRG
ncbi:inorganic phosphate transporter [Mesorhizobium sp. NBSH29]|uniref:inorganic phosphate transporter n=1 Tax=Mesorhizobium sp. NBSH29 TaxID=2654249 RepID=UPI00189689AF|nr:inorganic phosphate transporter [Mesorhizobium sp. NBSH29]QPC88038.1 inorganic phosphate transporter [Mesorhizobium sp. NBSH29]